MALAECQQCGKSFKVRPSRQSEGKGLYCSRECYFASRRQYAFAKTCESCGKVFYTKKNDVKYCSRACAGKGAKKVCDEPTLPPLASASLCWPQGLNQPFEDPWATGAIPPDRYGHDFRMPDMWLGF